MPTNIFIAFANEDRDVRDRLVRQMNLVKDREGWNIWSSHEIKAGTDWSVEIQERLEDSEVVILLLSTDFFHSEYIRDTELPAMIAKHREGSCHIIPVIARECLWKDTEFGDYASMGAMQALPEGEKPIVSKAHWDSEDAPYVQVVMGIKESVRGFQRKKKPVVVSPKPRQPVTWWRWAGSGAVVLAVVLMWLLSDPSKTLDAGQTPPATTEKAQPPAPSPDEAAFQKAQSTNTLPAWRDFQEKYPSSKYSEQAGKALTNLQETRDKDIADAQVYLFKVKDYDSARSLLNEVLRISPDDAEATKLLNFMPLPASQN